jgi:uncharacterized protein YndB with AHSA1/START domain
MSDSEYVYETFIKAPPERVWEGLTSAEFTRRYFWKTAVESTWEAGAAVVCRGEGGTALVEGKVLEADPPRKLSFTWRTLWSEELAEEPASRVSFVIEPMGEVCRLRVVHDRLAEASKVYGEVSRGWSMILCSLKTLIETGAALPVAGNEEARLSC